MAVTWLIVVLIFTSTYTASLTSILAAQQPVPSIQSYDDLARSSLPIGYQGGSFTGDYIWDSLLIRRRRLVRLVNESDYISALELGPQKKGGVAAILAESPYVRCFLNSECKYTSAGSEIAYFGGFGFAFQKNSSLTDAFSLAIVSMSKNRELQNLKESYLGLGKCITSTKSSFIPIQNLGGLFIVIGGIYGLCVSLRMLTWMLAVTDRRRLAGRRSRQVASCDQVATPPIEVEVDVRVSSVDGEHEHIENVHSGSGIIIEYTHD